MPAGENLPVFQRPILVAGALGRVSDAVRGRLSAAFVDGIGTSEAAEELILFADRPLRSWSSVDTHGWCWGQAFSLPAQPTGWQDIACRGGCAGVSVDRDGRATLHADATGAVPVFIDTHHDCVLFSTSVDFLVRLSEQPFHVDRRAWAEIIAGGMVMSHRTPFEEVRRLRPKDAWHAHHGQVTEARNLDPFPVEDLLPGNRATAAELIERVRLVVRRIEGDRLTVPLSGGWDSRFLAAVAVRDGRPVVTVTASDEFGRDEEQLWAAEVASRLGVPNERVAPPADWWRAAELAARQQEFLTSKNHWLVPLLKPLAKAGGTVLDGLAGDVLVKMNLPGELAEAGPAQLVTGMRHRFAPPVVPGEMLAQAFADEVDALVAERVEACWAEVEHHPAALHLLNYHLRTPTGVGLSPTLLFAAAAPIALPFLAHEVREHTLAVPPTDKREKRWYRHVMAQLDHALDEVPSTNDAKPVRRIHRRADLLPHVAEQTLVALSDPAVAGAIGPRLRAAMSSKNVLDPRHVPDRRVVRGLALYSRWARTYREHLVDWQLAGDGPGTQVWPGWSEPAPDQLSGVVPDGRWLDAQRVEPASLSRLGRTGRSTADPQESSQPQRAPATFRTALVVGAPSSFAELTLAIDDVASTLAPDGRVVLSLDLTAGPADSPGIGLMGVCEVVAASLALVHVEASPRRLRIIATVAAPSVPEAGMPPALLAAAIHGLEQRIALLADELETAASRLREVERARDAAETRADDAVASAQERLDQNRKLRRSVDRMRRRRAWRLVEAVGAARTSPVALIRLPWEVLRIIVRRQDS